MAGVQKVFMWRWFSAIYKQKRLVKGAKLVVTLTDIPENI